MKFHELQIGQQQNRKRVGRGIGSGRGKTAGRGTKGQNSRSGGGVRPGFEGGQNPLMQRLPKVRGFKKSDPNPPVLLKTDQLNRLAGASSEIDKKFLHEQGLIPNLKQPVRLLKRGDVSGALTIKLDHVSKSAAAAIIAAGGRVERS